VHLSVFNKIKYFLVHFRMTFVNKIVENPKNYYQLFNNLDGEAMLVSHPSLLKEFSEKINSTLKVGV
jgi:hypothetical protein